MAGHRCAFDSDVVAIKADSGKTTAEQRDVRTRTELKEAQ
jgi:hypothetical protein